MLYEKENKGECVYIYIYECEHTCHENMKKNYLKLKIIYCSLLWQTKIHAALHQA